MRIERLPTSHADVSDLLARYYAELRARFGFDASIAAPPNDMNPPGGSFYDDAGEPIACGGIRTHEVGTCEVKRMFVVPAARRGGHARRLLAALEDAARAAGFTRVVLDTEATLLEATALYDSSGYRRIPRYNDNPHATAWFEKAL
jgi:GNAT superfamily N-acetyltransferase